MKPAMVAFSFVLLVGACAGADGTDAAGSVAARGDRDCFNVSMVSGYNTVDRDTIRLRAGPSAQYDVDLSGAQCNMIEWSQSLAIESSPSSWICVGSQVGQGEVHFRDTATRRRISCYIEDVRRVEPATEVES
jgi:hypothetical protein